MRIAIVLLLFTAATLGDVHAQSIVLIDLSQEEGCGPAVLDTVRKDAIVAGFQVSSESPKQGLSKASQDDSKYRGALAAATQAYEKFDLARALVHLRQSDLMWKTQPEVIGIRGLSQRYLLQGLVHFAQEKPKKALSDFRLSHNLEPSRDALPTDRYRPSVVALYAQARRANEKSELVSVAKKWTPALAQLTVDGKSSTAEKLRAGVHLLKIAAPGYSSQFEIKSISSGVRLAYTLEALSADEKLLQLRQSLAGQDDLNKGALSEIATNTSNDALVLVKCKGGARSAAVYRVSDNTLTSWVTPGSFEWRNALSPQEPKTIAKNPLVAKPAHSRSWYKSWWGGGLIATGSSAVIGTALYFLLSSSSSSKGATIDQWCFGECL